MTQFLQLRSANSGAPFVGLNQDDTVLWDTTARAWYVGAGGGGGAVSSVFGRIGAVVAATGDYDGDQVDNVSGVPGASLSDALDYLLANVGAVASVFGRTGIVAAATGDYDSDQVDNISGVTGASVSDALDTLAARVTGVSSVFGRAGAVAAALGDYSASQITNDAAGIQGANVAAALQGLAYIQPVAAAAAGVNLALTGVVVVDGYAPTNGDRILAGSQTLPAQNGVYVYNNAGAWPRAADFDASNELRPGVFFVIINGATNGGMVAALITAPPVTIGTTPLVFAIEQNITQYSAAQLQEWFGDGSDGAVTLNGAVTLTRNMYYRDLTVVAGAALAANGFQVFVSQNLDISAAPTGALRSDGPLANQQSGATAGTGGVGFNSHTCGGSTGGGDGGLGNNAAGGAGVGATAGCNGGSTGVSGLGGTGSGGAGGAAAAGQANTNNRNVVRGWSRQDVNYRGTVFTITLGGSGAPGGGGGGGTGAAPGGGGGGGGSAGGVLYISARTVITGTNANTGVLRALGGAGANGSLAPNVNAGGGGGGSGGGGGWVKLSYLNRTGSTIVQGINVSGAAGGAGGNGVGTGTGGTGGTGGDAGQVTIIDMGNGATTYGTAGAAGTAGGAPSGVTGGTAGAAGAYLVDL